MYRLHKYVRRWSLHVIFEYYYYSGIWLYVDHIAWILALQGL